MKKMFFFIIIFITFFVAFYYFNMYKSKVEKNKYLTEVTKIYYIQVGAYRNETNVSKATKNIDSYVVEKKDDIYHVYIGVSLYKENIDKLKEIYLKKENNIYMRESTINNKKLIESIRKYDELLLKTSSYEEVLLIEKEILKIYKENIGSI